MPNSDDHLQGGAFHLDLKLTVSNICVAFVAVSYACGYMIYSSFARSVGVISVEQFRAMYFEVGLVFLFSTSVLFVLPCFIVNLVVDLYNEYEDLSLSKYACIISVVCFCDIVLLFALFVGRKEWESVPDFLLGNGVSISNGHLFYMFLSSFFVCVFLGFMLSRGCLRACSMVSRFRNAAIKFLIFCMALVVVLYVFVVFASIELVESIREMMNYIISGVFFSSLCFYVYALCSSSHVKNKYSIYICSLIIIPVVLYIVLNVYSNGFYRVLPVNRGGASPVSAETLFIKDGAVLPDGYVKEVRDGVVETVPVFIVVISQDFLYVTSLPEDEWVRGFGKRDIVCIQRSLVLGMYVEHI